MKKRNEIKLDNLVFHLELYHDYFMKYRLLNKGTIALSEIGNHHDLFTCLDIDHNTVYMKVEYKSPPWTYVDNVQISYTKLEV